MISKPSKSARKREHLALQSLGEQLIGLTPQQLAGIGLDERLLDAVLAAQGMRAHGALRRQKQLIGRLMRDTDPQPLQSALQALGRSDRIEKEIFRQAEQWRDRIVAGDAAALPELLEHIGRQSEALSSAVDAWRRAGGDKAAKQAGRIIFRQIQRELTMKLQNDSASI